MKVIGITGILGSGKTTVANLLVSAGYYVIDADKIGHDLLKKNTHIYKKIVSIYGNNILNSSKNIDRKKLAEKVFQNKTILLKLNSIMHPAIIKKIKNEIKLHSNLNLIFIDAPLLFEANALNLVDKIIVVRTSLKNILKRIKKLSKTEIKKRIKMQIPLKYKVSKADYIINNDGTVKDTELQLKKILKKIIYEPPLKPDVRA